jgi:mRNA-degrading endonuclease RelE of RelBE toxin-antitoxin system
MPPYRTITSNEEPLKWFSRIRVGKMRVIFEIGKDTDAIFIYEINFRGNIYD